jgi:integrase
MPSFFIRNKTIYLRYSERYKTYRLSTGIKVQANSVIDKDGLLLQGRDRFSMVINSRLIQLMAEIKQVLISDKPIDERIADVKRILSPDLDVPVDDTVTVLSYAKKVYNMAASGILITRSGTRHTEQSCNVIRTLVKHLDAVALRGLTLNLYEVDLNSKPVDKRREAAMRTREFYAAFKNYLSSVGLRVTTQSKYIETLLFVIGVAEKELLISIDKQIYRQKEEVPVVALTPEIVKDFMALDPSTITDVDIRYCYEVSYVILISSLRLSDAISLTINNIAMMDGQPVLFGYVNKKTGERTNTPIPMRLYNMLKKNYETFGSVYCSSHGYHAAEYVLTRTLPSLFKMLPSTHTPISVSRLKPDGVTYEHDSKPMYEYVRPHMLRRSAITSMLYSGVPERIVKFSSGHTGNSKSFERYVAYVDKVYNKEMVEYQRKISS